MLNANLRTSLKDQLNFDGDSSDNSEKLEKLREDFK